MTGSQPRPPLASVRVLELADGVAAAYCARQFALWGADVVVLEREGGSRLRRMGPYAGEGAARESLLWQFVAANKRAMSLRSARPDEDALLDLLRRADVLVTDWTDVDLERWGLTLDGLRERIPGLVLVSVSPFGLDGPYAGLAASELVVQALSGYAFFNGDKGRAPLKAPGHILGYACGVSAFVAALAVLVSRLESGRGRFIEVSAFDVIAGILPLLSIEYGGVPPQREGGSTTGVRAHRCRDGWVTFMPPLEEQVADYGAVLGVEDGEWPPVEDGEDPPAWRRRLIPFLAGKVRDKSADDVLHGLLRRRVVCGKVLSPADLLDDEHLAARGFFRTLRHPQLGELPFAGPAATLGRTGPAPPSPAPGAGEQVDPSQLDWSPAGRSTPDTGEGDSLPLEGVEIVDMTQAWIGPYAAMLLADLGADVIKVESHQRPDVWRRWLANPKPVGNVLGGHINTSPYYNSVNRNRRSLCLDLKTGKGRELLRRLVADADVLMENFTPRVMERFGFDWPAVERLNPGLVMTSWSGFGKTGPLSDYKATWGRSATPATRGGSTVWRNAPICRRHAWASTAASYWRSASVLPMLRSTTSSNAALPGPCRASRLTDGAVDVYSPERCTSLAPMQTKLTLRLDDRLIARAKDHARDTGKSLSQIVAEYFSAITSRGQPDCTQTPTVAGLRGVLKDAGLVGLSDYHAHLEDKHL